MKKLFLIGMAVIFAFLMSCRSDSNTDTPQLNLNGNWSPDKIVSTATQNGTTTTTTVVTNDCQKKGRLVFNSNSTGKVTYWDDSNGTCAIALAADFTYTFDPDTKKFSITINNNTMYGAVTTLTNSNVVIYYVDKSNPAISNNIEISATKVAN